MTTTNGVTFTTPLCASLRVILSPNGSVFVCRRPEAFVCSLLESCSVGIHDQARWLCDVVVVAPELKLATWIPLFSPFLEPRLCLVCARRHSRKRHNFLSLFLSSSGEYLATSHLGSSSFSERELCWLELATCLSEQMGRQGCPLVSSCELHWRRLSDVLWSDHFDILVSHQDGRTDSKSGPESLKQAEISR